MYPRSGFSFRGNVRTYPRSGFSQQTFSGRVRVKFDQNEGHEKATKKHEKRPNTVFLSRWGPRKSQPPFWKPTLLANPEHGKVIPTTESADCKRGRRKGATSKNVKNRQKVSKIFRHFSTIFAQGEKKVKNRQRVSKSFSTIFARHHFLASFRGPLTEIPCDTIGAKMITCRKNCFEQLILELHRITVHLLSFARIDFRL